MGAVTSSSLQEAGAFTEKIRDWLKAKPDSVPALLALADALIGEAELVNVQAKARHIDPNDAETNEEVTKLGEEIDDVMRPLPLPVVAELAREPEYCSATADRYARDLSGLGFGRFGRFGPRE